MDIDAHQHICGLVEQIVTAGEEQPDPSLLALIKEACRSSEDVIRTSLHPGQRAVSPLSCFCLHGCYIFLPLQRY